MKKITAKFTSKCAETGRTLRKGDTIFYDPFARKAYHLESSKAKDFEAEQERSSVAGYIQAQEDAYFDRMTGGYYSR